MTKIKGPDLVVQWVLEYDPIILIDDRDEVRELVRALPGATVAYDHKAFLNLEL